MNNIFEEIWQRKSNEGRTMQTKEEFQTSLEHLIKIITEFGRISEESAWKMLKRLDSIPLITQDKIDQICNEFGISFLIDDAKRLSPGIIAGRIHDVAPFGFFFILQTQQKHITPCRRREGKKPILSQEMATRIHERIRKEKNKP